MGKLNYEFNFFERVGIAIFRLAGNEDLYLCASMESTALYPEILSKIKHHIATLWLLNIDLESDLTYDSSLDPNDEIISSINHESHDFSLKQGFWKALEVSKIYSQNISKS